MILRGYIIEKYNNMANAYTCHRIIDEAKKMGIDIQIVGIHDTFYWDGKVWNNGIELTKRDFVINRYKYGNLKYYINKLGNKFYNDINLFGAYINKFEQLERISSDYFLLPKYLLSTSLINFDFLSTYLGVPFVAKGLESSMGREVFLIKNTNELFKLKHEFGIEKEWLFEEFIGCSYGKDIRVFSIRDKAIACMIRQSSNKDFRANVALGASVKAVPVTPTINNIVSDIYKITKLDFLGIDLLFGKDGFYLCEINVMPGLEGIERSSDKNISKMIIETIKADFQL